MRITLWFQSRTWSPSANGRPAKWYVGGANSQPIDLKIRALYVDARLKESPRVCSHDVSDRLFRVRRIATER